MSAVLEEDQYSSLSLPELISSLPTPLLSQMAAARFDVFSALVMPEAFSTDPAEFHNYLTDVVSHNQRTGRREAVVGPRGWGKSTTVTEGGVLWIICRNRFLEMQRQYRFVLIVSDTTAQAEARLAVIKDNLTTNPAIERFFPEVFGQGAVWRQDRIVTRGDTCIATAGMNTSIRGARYKTRRPDLIICHERGTMMRHEDSWIPVEQHPSFKQSFVKDGIRVGLHGIAHTETVTPEHMYWARTLIHARTGAMEPVLGSPQWVEARYLTKNHYIGSRISKEVQHPAEMEAGVYVPGAINIRDDAGRVISGGGGKFVSRHILELADPDIWFIVGLWWGDGSISGKNAFQIVYNKRDVHVVEKTQAILARYGVASTVTPREKDSTLTLRACWTHFVTFLRTWVKGNSKKTPPPAVERLPKEHMVELIRGYIAADGWVNDADTNHQSVRITSIHTPGLYAVQRMLASLGIISSVRKGAGPKIEKFPDGRICASKQKYDIRFRTSAKAVFGYNIADAQRYRTGKQFIADEYVWRAVKSVEYVEEAEFCPITTEDHTYETVFGVSHNCDDPDSIDTAKSPSLSVDLQDRFDRDLIPCGHKETDILVVGTVLSKTCLVYKILNDEHYGTWNGRLFKAMEHFPTHMKFWDTWGSMLNNKALGQDRFAQAEAYYQTNKAVMDIGGVSNWPARYTAKELMYMYYAGGRKAFLTEQQNQIVDSGATHFQLERYRLLDAGAMAELEKDNPLYYAYIDPSGGASAASKTALATRGPDKFSIAVIAKFDRNFFVLVESVGRQLRQSSQFEEIAKVLAKWDIYKLTVENNAGQVHYVTALNKFLTEKFADEDWVAQSATRYQISARGVSNSVPKNDRISMLEPYLDNGTLQLPLDIHTKHRDLADEFDEWPSSQFDDCLDAVSGCFFSAYRTFQLRYLSD